MVVNRVGDVGITLAIFTGFYVFKSVDFVVMNGLVEEVKSQTIVFFNSELNVLSVLSFFLLVGAVGKSAQVGLHT